MFELGRLDFMSLYYIRKAKFIMNLCVSSNSTLRFLSSYYIISNEYRCFLGKNDLYAEMSFGQVKTSIISKFNGRFAQ
jgi:hypothetical protein